METSVMTVKGLPWYWRQVCFLKAVNQVFLLASWNFASILRRFPIIYGYPLQWDFPYGVPKMADLGRSIRPRWTNVLASISHTDVSLRSFCHTPPFVVAFWVHCTVVHFLGHVTRFHSNRCYGNQNKCVFWKWSIVLFAVSRTVFA